MFSIRKTKGQIWKILQNRGRSPPSSVDLQESTSSITGPGTIQPKIIEQPGTSTESSNVGLVMTSPQTTDTVVGTNFDQKSDADTVSTNIRPPPRLFALIIGINKYESPDIKNLLGAVPDADAMRDYLQKHLRIPSSQIRNLRDSEATRTAIIEGIEGLLCDDEIKEGDPIVIYYAGHGGWADAPAGWEAGGTKIQLLVPCDYSSELEAGEQKHAVPDRTLAALLSRLAIKKGDNITVILDCCHSGSGTRNDSDPTELVRGIDVANVPSDLDRDVWKDFESSNGSERGTVVNASFTHSGLRSHVLLAACDAEESALERKSRGLFTQGLLRVLMAIGIDKLTYADLLQQMPHLPRGQHPQCEGVNQHRIIFNAKVPGKSTIYHKIRQKGERYVMPDVGAAHGIAVGAEFEVYKEQDSSDLLGIVVAIELSPFSTTLDAKESSFALEGNGVALQTSTGNENVLRIHVTDEGLKDIVRKIERTDPNQRIIQLVDWDQAEFGMALENGKVVFNIFDSVVRNHGLTQMPFVLDTLDDIPPIIRAADHFYWHLRRTPRLETDAKIGLANAVEIEVAELEHDGNTYDDDFEPVLSPTQAGWTRGKDFNLQIKGTGTIYGWKIVNNCNVALYPALFYFDNSDWSITSYYQPPTVRGIVDPPGPLKGQQYLPVGYGDSGSVPHAFYLRKGQNVDVGFLKLFLSRNQVNFSHIAQPSPFASVGGRYTAPAEVTRSKNLRLLWDTIVFPVVQRRAESADE